MTGDVALPVGLVATWVVATLLVRAWLRDRIRRVVISQERAGLILAAMFATIPLLALPWAPSPFWTVVLVGLSVAMFLFEAVLFKLALRFINGR
jgi:hypothetical protein